jgi:hypothetical protein
VLASLQEPIAVQGRRVAIDASIGIALPLHGQDADELLRARRPRAVRREASGKGCWRVHAAPPVLTPGRSRSGEPEGLPPARGEPLPAAPPWLSPPLPRAGRARSPRPPGSRLLLLAARARPACSAAAAGPAAARWSPRCWCVPRARLLLAAAGRRRQLLSDRPGAALGARPRPSRRGLPWRGSSALRRWPRLPAHAAAHRSERATTTCAGPISRSRIWWGSCTTGPRTTR